MDSKQHEVGVDQPINLGFLIIDLPTVKIIFFKCCHITHGYYLA